MKRNAALAEYMNFVSEDGLDLDRYVEHGARMLKPADAAALGSGVAELREKITALSPDHPQLARQLAFLMNFHEANPPNLPENVRNETLFALLYAARELDLVPDGEPKVGYLDDAAVTESVLSRHAGVFEIHCDYHRIDWAALKPVNQG
jgi:uncharacterized membrane protein YkvA (DUF1232 family)